MIHLNVRKLTLIASFLGLWLLVGFSTGTLLLVGPLRWFVNVCRDRGWPSAVERGGVIAIIAILIAGTALLTGILIRAMRASKSRPFRVGVPLLAFVLAAVATGLWLRPGAMSGLMGAESRSTRFTFGPYPTEAKMLELKAAGYTIISLLHPAVVPFEPVMLAREKEAARRTGVRFISLPMLPWVSGNTESLAAIQTLARDQSAKYYVHCYLGRDRVRIVQTLVAPDTGALRTLRRRKAAGRSIADLKKLERGAVYRLGKDGFLTGYPTEEEFFSFILDGETSQVVALMDPTHPEDKRWIEAERKVLQEYRMPFLLIPIEVDRYDPAVVLEAVKKTRKLPKPFVVHSFLSPSTGRSPWAEGFLQAYRSELPPLPPSLFRAPLQAGKAEVIAVNIAIGPRPQVYEFDSLYQRGVRNLVFIEDPGSVQARDDRAAALTHSMNFVATTDSEQIIRMLSSGGPYYVYGGLTVYLTDELKGRYGPAIPPR